VGRRPLAAALGRHPRSADLQRHPPGRRSGGGRLLERGARAALDRRRGRSRVPRRRRRHAGGGAQGRRARRSRRAPDGGRTCDRRRRAAAHQRRHDRSRRPLPGGLGAARRADVPGEALADRPRPDGARARRRPGAVQRPGVLRRRLHAVQRRHVRARGARTSTCPTSSTTSTRRSSAAARSSACATSWRRAAPPGTWSRWATCASARRSRGRTRSCASASTTATTPPRPARPCPTSRSCSPSRRTRWSGPTTTSGSRAAATKTDWEVELGIVIGSRCQLPRLEADAPRRHRRLLRRQRRQRARVPAGARRPVVEGQVGRDVQPCGRGWSPRRDRRRPRPGHVARRQRRAPPDRLDRDDDLRPVLPRALPQPVHRARARRPHQHRHPARRRDGLQAPGLPAAGRRHGARHRRPRHPAPERCRPALHRCERSCSPVPREAGRRRGRAPVPRAPGEVVVDVERVGRVRHRRRVLHRRDGVPAPTARAYPMRLGHEWCGSCRRSAPMSTDAWVGRRVTGDTMLGCGHVPALPLAATSTSASTATRSASATGGPARWPSSCRAGDARCTRCRTRSTRRRGAGRAGRQRAAHPRRQRLDGVTGCSSGGRARSGCSSRCSLRAQGAEVHLLGTAAPWTSPGRSGSSTPGPRRPCRRCPSTP
jgi:hypothetical protein